jgi:hypothetical protein
MKTDEMNNDATNTMTKDKTTKKCKDSEENGT